MLHPRVNGQLPGYIFKKQGSEVELEITVDLLSRDNVGYVEIVKNGEVVEKVEPKDYTQAQCYRANLGFEESGWMLIRAIANNPKTFRFASSGPYLGRGWRQSPCEQ